MGCCSSNSIITKEGKESEIASGKNDKNNSKNNNEDKFTSESHIKNNFFNKVGKKLIVGEINNIENPNPRIHESNFEKNDEDKNILEGKKVVKNKEELNNIENPKQNEQNLKKENDMEKIISQNKIEKNEEESKKENSSTLMQI